ncbi:MAG: ATP-binding cassette domain-containing protein [Alphaproteobacteria bacterium]|nr:ATP-binding cassette domain-containing protein [Alphaproteobacteria bacterium]
MNLQNNGLARVRPPSLPPPLSAPAVSAHRRGQTGERALVFSACRITAESVTVDWWGRTLLKGVTLGIERNQVTALAGPPGSGKSTFLRCLNRANDLVENCRVGGLIRFDGVDIHHPDVDTVRLRNRIGMIFPCPNPYPKSIFENIAHGPRVHGLVRSREEEKELVLGSLRKVGLLGEVGNHLDRLGPSLSPDQQQRLCIARALALGAEVLLLDDPCRMLDSAASAKIEALIAELRSGVTLVVATRSLEQAARLSPRVGVFHLGTLIEWGHSGRMFSEIEAIKYTV